VAGCCKLDLKNEETRQDFNTVYLTENIKDSKIFSNAYPERGRPLDPPMLKTDKLIVKDATVTI
jgi:hypothetical protein